MSILVTGGAGYIGSHMVRELLRTGARVVVVDDLSAGHADALPNAVPFVRADIRDRAAVSRAISDHEVDAICHFASRIQVGESVVNPRLYFRDNLGATIELLESALDANVRRFVFSSSAAVYGDPVRVPLDEDHPLAPVNAYGATKLAVERILTEYDRAYGLRYVALRYFNAAGADPDGDLGERHHPESHLIPLVIDAALGKRTSVSIFGDDYATPDGTCVRDYVHVRDLAEAHVSALEYLAGGGTSAAINLGTGVGHSVREVVRVVEEVSGRRVPVVKAPRRAGDPPELVAAASRASRVLGWTAKRTSLEEIVRDAWRYRSSTP